MNTSTKIVKQLAYPQIGHWHFEFIFKPAYDRLGAMHFSLGFFKLNMFPPQGEMVQKYHYSGVWLRWNFHLPVWGVARNWKTWKEIRAEMRKVEPVIGVDLGHKDGDKTVLVEGERHPDGTVHTKGMKKL